MSQYSKKNAISDQTREEAMKIARGTKKPGQTKEQTKLIAQGIQKGIDQYKKQQKSKARELNKKLKQVSKKGDDLNDVAVETGNSSDTRSAVKLPWILLMLSWLGFALYVVLTQK